MFYVYLEKTWWLIVDTVAFVLYDEKHARNYLLWLNGLIKYADCYKNHYACVLYDRSVLVVV